MKPYLTSSEETLNQLGVTAEGLSTQEATARLEKHGPNKLAEGKKTTLMQRFLSQLADPMIIVLLVVVVITFVMALTFMIRQNQSLSDRLLDVAFKQPVQNVQQMITAMKRLSLIQLYIAVPASTPFRALNTAK